jgi:CheY-like chemotaxis protein
VLLAEDNPVNQQVALGMLEALGCQVDLAGDGREALEAVAQGSYDLVLMDCQMPEMDGFAATAAIRTLEVARRNVGRRRIPVIALTANAMKGDRERCLAAGMDDYLAKPFTLGQLGEVLARWLPAAAPAACPEVAAGRS